MNPRKNLLLRLKYSRIIIFLLGFVLAVFVLVYGIKYAYHIFSIKGDSAELNSNQSSIIEKVGKIILLPEETPTLATVSDLQALKNQDQSFYQNAKVGDIVLFYSKAKKAIIYDPRANMIINVALFEV